MTLEDVRRDHEVQVFIARPTRTSACSATPSTARGTRLVAGIAQNVLLRLGYPQREAELAAIAGYLHDIGNGINRLDHGIAAALLSRHVLERLGMRPEEYAEVMCAIGNHEEEYGAGREPAGRGRHPRRQVRRAPQPRARHRPGHRRHPRPRQHGDHAVVSAVDGEEHTITLELEIDTDIIQVMHYFEIFLARMVMCRRAAEFLGCPFGLVINGTRLL